MAIDANTGVVTFAGGIDPGLLKMSVSVGGQTTEQLIRRARHIHVAPSGHSPADPAAPLGSAANPYTSLQAALGGEVSHLAPGTVVTLQAGMHSGRTVIRNLQGTAGAPIVIRGEGKNQTLLTGELPLSPSAWNAEPSVGAGVFSCNLSGEAEWENMDGKFVRPGFVFANGAALKGIGDVASDHRRTVDYMVRDYGHITVIGVNAEGRPIYDENNTTNNPAKLNPTFSRPPLGQIAHDLPYNGGSGNYNIIRPVLRFGVLGSVTKNGATYPRWFQWKNKPGFDYYKVEPVTDDYGYYRNGNMTMRLVAEWPNGAAVTNRNLADAAVIADFDLEPGEAIVSGSLRWVFSPVRTDWAGTGSAVGTAIGNGWADLNPAAGEAGRYFFDAGSRKLYVKLTGGVSPSTRTLTAGRHGSVLNIQARDKTVVRGVVRNVRVQDIEFRGNADQWNGLDFRVPGDQINNDFGNGDSLVAVGSYDPDPNTGRRYESHLEFTRCHFHHGTFTGIGLSSEYTTISDCVMESCGNGGMNGGGGTWNRADKPAPRRQNNVVTRCIIRGNNIFAYIRGFGDGVKMIPNPRGWTFDGNLFVNNPEHGLWFDGGLGSIIVRNNVFICSAAINFENCQRAPVAVFPNGQEDADTFTGIVENNLIYQGFSTGGPGTGTWSGIEAYGCEGMIVRYNTVVGSQEDNSGARSAIEIGGWPGRGWPWSAAGGLANVVERNIAVSLDDLQSGLIPHDYSISSHPIFPTPTTANYNFITTSLAASGYTGNGRPSSQNQYEFIAANENGVTRNLTIPAIAAGQSASINLPYPEAVAGKLAATYAATLPHGVILANGVTAVVDGNVVLPCTVTNRNDAPYPGGTVAVQIAVISTSPAKTLAEVQALGLEANGTTGDPNFVNLAAWDLRLKPGSPAAGNGVDFSKLPDLDHDGLPDWWELNRIYSGGISSSAGQDLDAVAPSAQPVGQILTNAQIFAATTNPLSSSGTVNHTGNLGINGTLNLSAGTIALAGGGSLNGNDLGLLDNLTRILLANNWGTLNSTSSIADVRSLFTQTILPNKLTLEVSTTPGEGSVFWKENAAKSDSRNVMAHLDGYDMDGGDWALSVALNHGETPTVPRIYHDALMNRTTIGHNTASVPQSTATFNVEGSIAQRPAIAPTGNPQAFTRILSGVTTTGATVELTSDGAVAGAENRFIVESGKSYVGTATIIARRADGLTRTVVKTFAFKNIGGASSLVPSNITVVKNTDTSAGTALDTATSLVVLNNPTGDDYFQINATGTAGIAIQWAAKIELLQINN